MKRVIDKNQDEFLTQDGQWWWVPLKEQSSVKKLGRSSPKKKPAQMHMIIAGSQNKQTEFINKTTGEGIQPSLYFRLYPDPCRPWLLPLAGLQGRPQLTFF
jgi:hypothetical protein